MREHLAAHLSRTPERGFLGDVGPDGVKWRVAMSTHIKQGVYVSIT